MNKLFSLIIMLPFILSALQFVPASAGDIVLGPTSEPAEMEIIYTVGPSYAVTIPASVSIDAEGNGTAQLKIAAEPVTENGMSVAVSMQKSESYNKLNQFALFLKGVFDPTQPYVSYTITAEDRDLSAPDNSTPLLTQLAGAQTEASLTLTFKMQGNPSIVGKYTDKLTFAVYTVNP